MSIWYVVYMKIKIFKASIISFILISCIYLSLNSNQISRSKRYSIPNIDPNKLYLVLKVLDGDTFQIKIDKRLQTVRMLGIDTPETVDPRKKVQCYGKEASKKTKEILSKHSVRLVLDSSQNTLDKFGRILAYVYRDDGLYMNQYLLENGYAREYTYSKQYKEQMDFKSIENQASISKLGLWNSCSKI